MIGTLIKKDWRLNRAIIIGAIIFSVLPYVSSAIFVNFFPPEYAVYREMDSRRKAESMQTSAYACQIIVVLLAAALGGAALAGERRERTAEFLAMLPAPRSASVYSKIFVAAGCMTFFIAIHLLALAAINVWTDSVGVNRLRGPGILGVGGIAIAYSIVLFGVAWAVSVFIRSPAIAACVGIAVGFAILFGGTAWIVAAFERWRIMGPFRNSEDSAITITACIAATMGIVSIGISTLYYLRRVEP